MAKRTTAPIEVRLLCAPQVALSEWGPLAARLAAHADEIKVAALPRTLEPLPIIRRPGLDRKTSRRSGWKYAAPQNRLRPRPDQ